MSRENVEAMRAAHRAWNEGGAAALAQAFWHPEIVWHEPPDAPGAGVHRGREEVIRYFSEFVDPLGKLRIDRDEVIASDENLVVAVVHLVGTAPASEIPVALAEVALTPRDALYDALSLGERVGQLARANSLHVQDGSVVLTFDSKTEDEARADTELALSVELGGGWRERVVLT